MPDIKADVGMQGRLELRVTRHRPTLRSRVADAWAAFLRRFRP